MEVSESIKQKVVKDSFETYRDWECNTKDAYSVYSKALYDMDRVADAAFVEDLVKDVDVDEELKQLDRIYIMLIGTNYDMAYISVRQDSLHEEYKKKLKEGTHIDIC